MSRLAPDPDAVRDVASGETVGRSRWTVAQRCGLVTLIVRDSIGNEDQWSFAADQAGRLGAAIQEAARGAHAFEARRRERGA